ERVKHRAQIDVESLGTLPGEHPHPARSVGVEPLGREGWIVRHGGGAGIGRNRHQKLVSEKLPAVTPAHFGNRIGLATRKPLRAGAVERRDSLQRERWRTVWVAAGRDRPSQPTWSADRPVFRFETKLVDDVVGFPAPI